jgi:hypothetical protein
MRLLVHSGRVFRWFGKCALGLSKVAKHDLYETGSEQNSAALISLCVIRICSFGVSRYGKNKKIVCKP